VAALTNLPLPGAVVRHLPPFLLVYTKHTQILNDVISPSEPESS